MTRVLLALLASAAATTALAQDRVPATLVGHSALPAASFSDLPADAPAEAAISGKFLATMKRADAPGSVAQPTGLPTPFQGQPMQGFSGYATTRGADGTLLGVIDNGFGSKVNSPDALLSFVRLMPDFDTGATKVVERVWLRDPNKVVPFRIVHEATEARYLTGGDFDTESIQQVGDTIWIGDEFGPFLISATTDGVITGVYPTLLDGKELRSPDHPAVTAGAVAGKEFTVARSGGYEGMALAEDGKLWAILEKPVMVEGGANEGSFLRVIEFDPAAKAWTGRSVKFALSEGAAAIGDFNMIDATRGLIIERDNGQGDPSLACAEGQTTGCFKTPAKLKVVTLVDFGRIDAEGFVARVRQIDLMDLADPDNIARIPSDAKEPQTGRYTMPFVTIESVLRDGPEHILVSNDNNLPFSAGRKLVEADANEIVRLHVPELLAE
jgi:hypothetical protein